jgi:hypothetical protein
MNQVDQIITLLGGGRETLQKLCNVRTASISMWKRDGKIPTKHYPAIIYELRDRGRPAPDWLDPRPKNQRGRPAA